MTKRQLFNPSAFAALKEGVLLDPETAGLSIEARTSRAGVKRVWLYRRRIAGSRKVVKRVIGTFPCCSLDQARAEARALSEEAEAGRDPRVCKAEPTTVAEAHAAYMEAVRQGRIGNRRRLPRLRTVADKLEIYNRDIAPLIARYAIADVHGAVLVKLVLAKGQNAPIRATRLAAELSVFFGWASSINGASVGLKCNPASRLRQLRYPEEPRERYLDTEELELLLKAPVAEEQVVQRAMLLLLLSGCRLSVVVLAPSEEISTSGWLIPGARTKNRVPHQITPSAWVRALLDSAKGEWLIPDSAGQKPKRYGWCRIVARLSTQMSRVGNRDIIRWSPHDLRRTFRTNAVPNGVRYEVAEALLNHKKKGARPYIRRVRSRSRKSRSVEGVGS